MNSLDFTQATEAVQISWFFFNQFDSFGRISQFGSMICLHLKAIKLLQLPFKKFNNQHLHLSIWKIIPHFCCLSYAYISFTSFFLVKVSPMRYKSTIFFVQEIYTTKDDYMEIIEWGLCSMCCCTFTCHSSTESLKWQVQNQAMQLTS